MKQYIDKNKLLKPFARSLRSSMTDQERHLWYDFLKNCGYQFNRQYIVGNYILDFYCAKKLLAIEVDGGQHYERDNIFYDENRTKYLNSFGIKVLRYTNTDIEKNFDNVCLDIFYHLNNEK